MAVVCAPERVIVCAEDTLPGHCALVEGAVAEFNAVVPGLLSYQGVRSWDAIGRAKAAGLPWTVIADIERAAVPSLDKNTLAVTLVHPTPDTMCLGFTPIGLLWAEGELTIESQYQVIMHEMLHSLGAAHADTMCPWSTLMRPALNSEYRHGLSIIDRNWLRAVYGQ